MDDLKLLYANETTLEFAKAVELVTFDTNMSRVYVTDHDRIYEIDSADSKVIKYASLIHFNDFLFFVCQSSCYKPSI